MHCISLSVLFLRLCVSSHVVVVHSLSLCIIVPSVNITQFILNRNISFSSYLLLRTVLPCTIWYIWINESFLRVCALEARLLDVGICVFSPQLDNADCFPKCSSGLWSLHQCVQKFPLVHILGSAWYFQTSSFCQISDIE